MRPMSNLVSKEVHSWTYFINSSRCPKSCHLHLDIHHDGKYSLDLHVIITSITVNFLILNSFNPMSLILFLLFLTEIDITVTCHGECHLQSFFTCHSFSYELKFKYSTSALTRHACDWF